MQTLILKTYFIEIKDKVSFIKKIISKNQNNIPPFLVKSSCFSLRHRFGL